MSEMLRDLAKKYAVNDHGQKPKNIKAIRHEISINSSINIKVNIKNSNKQQLLL